MPIYIILISAFIINFLNAEDALIKNRDAVEAKYKWAKEALYPSAKKWYLALEKTKNSSDLKKLLAYQNKLGKNSRSLKEALDLFFKIERKIECLQVYAQIWKDEDMSQVSAEEAYSNAQALGYDFEIKTSWMEPEILNLPQKKMQKFLKDPVLKDYRFYLENMLRSKEHVLNSAEEKLLAEAAKALDTSRKTFGALNGLDVVFSPVQDSAGKTLPMSHETYYVYIKSPDRILRKNAFESIHSGFEKMENTLTELLAGHVQKHIFCAKANKFKSSLEAALFKHNIDPAVYTNLIQTVKAHNSALARFVSLKKKLLNLADFHVYDLSAPVVEGVDFHMDVEEAKLAVLNCVAVLGKEYQDRLRKGLNEERWIDYFETEHKKPGGYSSGCYDSYPYILLNFHGTLNDSSTLAHEAGHSMQSELTNKTQLYVNSVYSIFIAEIASTFNEQLFMDYLLQKTKDKKQKAYLLSYLLDNMQATFFRQTLFADFELTIHQLAEKGVPLTLSLLKQTYKQLYRDYYGPDLIVDDQVAIEWARVPHFYYDFYVYQYSTGIAAAVAYLDEIKNKNDCQQYLTFLKSGNSRYPLDLLKSTGVDLTRQEPILAFIKRFESLIGQLEEITAQIAKEKDV